MWICPAAATDARAEAPLAPNRTAGYRVFAAAQQRPAAISLDMLEQIGNKGAIPSNRGNRLRQPSLFTRFSTDLCTGGKQAGSDKDETMLAIFATLAFAAAAILAAATILATWTRYRDVALGNLAALRGVSAEREFRVRMLGLGRQPVLAGHPALRRLPHRARGTRPIRTAAARRAAA